MKKCLSKIDKNNINSIIVNVNININTNKANISNNTNNCSNINNKNIFCKSPSQKYSKHQRIFSSNNNNLISDSPLLSERNERRKTNYSKIRKNQIKYNNQIVKTENNIINEKKKKSRNLNSIEPLLLIHSINNTCNKENLFFNNNIFKTKNDEIEKVIKDIKNVKINPNIKEIYKRNNNNNRFIYFSPNKFFKAQKYINTDKNIENNNKTNNIKFIYHKKSNNIIASSKNKKIQFTKISFQPTN